MERSRLPGAVRALIFDMDGVVIDSNDLHAEAWRLYLSQHNLPADGMMERMHGKRNDEIVRDLFGSQLSDQEVFNHGASKEELYRQMMKPQLGRRLVRGVRDFLERHKAELLGLASNAEPANVDFVLDEAGLRKYFRVVVHGHEVKHPKPDPEIYLRVAKFLGVPPRDCVVFEDSAAGIEAAKAAGARVVAVRTTAASLPETDFTIRDFADPELDPWLRALPGSRGDG
ncbi:MAG: beta-phosphoglucomutase family hydrolase [Bryobacteraceae bacterium]|nr:beta-phosphoglucomutase family hydrolase [Bryobacteraceae bacterium]MDW8377910.1 beta-phosphoglucomutase family hydrolase [Bryobacterales bacterium]